MKNENPNFNRRNFIKGLGTLGAGAMVPLNQYCTNRHSQGADESAAMKIPTRPFGNTGVDIPVLILGAARDMGKKHALLATCLKYGVNYWDTSVMYSGGMAETGLGEYFAKNPGSREGTFIVSKADDIWDNMPDTKRIEKELNTSLTRFGVDQLDAYCPLHAVEFPEQITPELGEWAKNKKAEGKFRLVGLSTHNNMAAILKRASETDWVDFVYAKYNVELLTDEDMQRSLDACYNAGKGIVAIKTQRTLSKQLHLEGPFETAAVEEMVEHFLDGGFTEGQAKLKLVLQDERISGASVGMEDIGILMQNVAAILDQTRLSEKDMAVLNQYCKATSHLSCLGCAHICKKAMPEMPYIADVLRYMVYYHGHCQFEMAKQNYARLPLQIRENITNFDYTGAEAVCPQKIAIGELVREASGLLASA
ncbi:MAG: aldo/keto reductase [Bacteroidota bacterium]